MKTQLNQWLAKDGWRKVQGDLDNNHAQLVLAFGSRSAISDPMRFEEMRAMYPIAQLMMCSTAGEIMETEVFDDSISLSAIQFEHTEVKTGEVVISDYPGRRDAGRALGRQLLGPKLALVFVLSDGQNVNGSELVAGLNEAIGGKVPVTGGLAGDGAEFAQTAVGLNAVPAADRVIAVGFYGDAIKVGHGSVGGWDPFGPERVITRADSNVLYELDDTSALELYKSYLGERASELPGSALLFPLSITTEEGAETVVRTVLAVDEAAQSMTFAGDIPQGAKARLMKANFDRLIDGAGSAATGSLSALSSFKPGIAILISCVGRKLILGPRIEEEVEEASLILGSGTPIAGFYSYGELSPLDENRKCELHNQTMTITTLAEVI